MSDELVANFTLNNTSLNAQYEISEVEQIDATFKIYANGTEWGNIQGDIADQTDLIDLIDTKIDIEATARENNDLLLQNGINTLNDNLTAEISNRGTADGILQDNIDTLSDTVTSNYNTLDGAITSEATTRANADTTLQNNIDTLSGTVSDNYTTLDGKIGDNKTSIDNHITDKTNPHEVTKAQVGLGNVDNTSDLNKPISTATQTALDDKQNTINDLSEIRLNASNGQSAYNTIKTFGDIVTYDASSFATNLQGQKADTALQPNDDISKLNNDAGYITSADVPTVNNSTITFQKNNITVGDINLNQANNKTINFDIPTTASDVNALPDTTTINELTTTAQQNAINSGATSNNIGQIATNTANLNSLQTTVTNNYNTLDNRITSEVSNLNSAISTEATNRQNADNNLQSQIDALVVASDVFDIVGTYAELQAYDISTVPVNDIIKVLVDSTHNNAATYYRCVENDNVKSWSYIGAEGAYYTKSEADGRFVEQTTTVNGQALSNNITLDAEDVGALPDSTTIGNGTLTIQKNGSTIDSFGANDTGNTTVNITVPTDTSDLTNNAGYITGINSTDVTNALGYTPYNATNPEGYTDNVGTVTSVNNTQPDSNGNVTISIPQQVQSNWNETDTSSKAYIQNKPTIPSTSNFVTTNTAQNISARKTFVGEKAIYFKQSSSNNKLGFTLYNNSYTEVGGLEYNPSSNILALNAPKTGNTLLGFRYWSDNNIIMPKPSSSGNYYLPLSFKSGSTTVTTNSSGVVDLSSLIPAGSDLDVQVNGTSIVSNDVANIVTNTAYNASTNKIATMSDLPMTDDMLSSSSTNPVQNKIITGALDDKQDVIPDLSTIRSGASAGSTAVQPNDLATVATTGDYDDLINKPTIPDVMSLLQTIYPVGSVYLSTNATCPLASLFGTWTLVSSGRALWTGTGSNGGTTISAGLPNITGGIDIHAPSSPIENYPSNAFTNGNAIKRLGGDQSKLGNQALFDASLSNSIYGNSTTVQPPAYVVNVWRRTA